MMPRASPKASKTPGVRGQRPRLQTLDGDPDSRNCGLLAYVGPTGTDTACDHNYGLMLNRNVVDEVQTLR